MSKDNFNDQSAPRVPHPAYARLEQPVYTDFEVSGPNTEDQAWAEVFDAEVKSFVEEHNSIYTEKKQHLDSELAAATEKFSTAKAEFLDIVKITGEDEREFEQYLRYIENAQHHHLPCDKTSVEFFIKALDDFKRDYGHHGNTSKPLKEHLPKSLLEVLSENTYFRRISMERRDQVHKENRALIKTIWEVAPALKNLSEVLAKTTAVGREKLYAVSKDIHASDSKKRKLDYEIKSLRPDARLKQSIEPIYWSAIIEAVENGHAWRMQHILKSAAPYEFRSFFQRKITDHQLKDFLIYGGFDALRVMQENGINLASELQGNTRYHFGETGQRMIAEYLTNIRPEWVVNGSRSISRTHYQILPNRECQKTFVTYDFDRRMVSKTADMETESKTVLPDESFSTQDSSCDIAAAHKALSTVISDLPPLQNYVASDFIEQHNARPLDPHKIKRVKLKTTASKSPST